MLLSWESNCPWNTEPLAIDNLASRTCSKGSTHLLRQQTQTLVKHWKKQDGSSPEWNSTQQHGIVWHFKVSCCEGETSLAHRGLTLFCTETGHRVKWKKIQSPVVSCTAVFTGASSLKTEDILRRVVTNFSTSDVSVWKMRKKSF